MTDPTPELTSEQIERLWAAVKDAPELSWSQSMIERWERHVIARWERMRRRMRR